MTTLATQTLAAIEAAFQQDQGAKYRGLLKELMPLAGDAYSTKEEKFRSHLGASLIGRECARELWYTFRWCTSNNFDGRMLRLFNRGHLEEPRMVALLLMIGCKVWQVNSEGKQFRITGHRGHFGGSMDAVAVGIPDLDPTQPVLTEFKTHGDKSFTKLVADGLLAAKWEHYIQMQIYMGKNCLLYGLYCAVNKNTDELYMEIIKFDEAQYHKYLGRSEMIIDAIAPPPRISTSPGFFKCKFCDHQQLCHLSKLPEKNCRTCSFSVLGDEGKWFCSSPEVNEGKPIFSCSVITQEQQLKACDHYTMNPAIKNAL